MIEIGKQKDANYYNKAYQKFAEKKGYTKPYHQSVYYPLWQKIIPRLEGDEMFLDIGCGTGQLAKMLFDFGVKSYIGIDFSIAAIKIARRICPQFTFICKNVMKKNVIEEIGFNTILATEFLEHIDKDVNIFKRINEMEKRIKVIFSVPNFPSPGHVRYFESLNSVILRYNKFIELIHSETITIKGSKLYLITGYSK